MNEMRFLKEILPLEKESTLSWNRLVKGKKIGPFIHKEENEYILSGPAHYKLIINNDEFIMDSVEAMNYVFIPKGATHAFENLGDTFEYFIIKIKA